MGKKRIIVISFLFIFSFLLSTCSYSQRQEPAPTSTSAITLTNTPTKTLTPTLTATSSPTPTPSSVTILGQIYNALPPPDGKTSPDSLAAENNLDHDRNYIYTSINNQTYLVDVYNGERVLEWQNGTWNSINDAVIRFGYLLQADDTNNLTQNAIGRMYDPYLGKTYDTQLLEFSFRWTGNTKIVTIQDPNYADHYPYGINFLAIQGVGRLGSDKNSKMITAWFAVIQDMSTSENPDAEIDEDDPIDEVETSHSLLDQLGLPGEKYLRGRFYINPDKIDFIKDPYACGPLPSFEGESSDPLTGLQGEISGVQDAWSSTEICRVEVDYLRPFTKQLEKFINGKITQEDLNQIGFIPVIIGGDFSIPESTPQVNPSTTPMPYPQLTSSNPTYPTNTPNAFRMDDHFDDYFLTIGVCPLGIKDSDVNDGCPSNLTVCQGHPGEIILGKAVRLLPDADSITAIFNGYKNKMEPYCCLYKIINEDGNMHQTYDLDTTNSGQVTCSVNK